MSIDILSKIDPLVTDLGYEIVDIERTTQYGQKHLTVYIDRLPDGVCLDDCEKIHYAVETAIDALDPYGGDPYILEISSPGLDRPFKSQRDFERNYGKEVEVKLFAPLRGKKIYEGKLIERTSTFVIIESSGEQNKIEMNRISLVRPSVKFE